MAKTPEQLDEQLIGWAVRDDRELRVQIRKLAWAMVGEAYNILNNGTPQAKMAILQRLVPPMMKALGEEDQSGRGIDDLRAEFRDVLDEVHHADDKEPAA